MERRSTDGKRRGEDLDYIHKLYNIHHKLLYIDD